MSTIRIAAGETIKIDFPQGMVTLHSNGEAQVDCGLKGYTVDIFEEPGGTYVDFTKPVTDPIGRYEPSRLDYLGSYLHLLYEAQKVDHNVHEEITAALKQYKQEAGI